MKRIIALCLCLAALLCGCSVKQYEAPASTTESALQEYEEIVVPTQEPEKEYTTFGLSYLPAYGLNPFLCNVTANRAIFSLMYEGLFTINEQFRAEPVLCESFRVSDDGRTYRFTLVDAKFSDGTPVTAADVEASIAAAKKSPMYKERLSHVVYYIPEDDKTLLVQLDTPYENLAMIMDIPVVKLGTEEDPLPVGSGPYVSRSVKLVRNPYWWQEDFTVLDYDEIQLQVATKPNDLRDNFEFGGTNLVYFDPNSPAAVGFRCDYEVWEAPTTVMHYIGFNLYSGYFTNDALRAAVTYIVDRETLVNRAYGGYAVASELPCSPKSDLFDPQLAENYDYAPASFMEALSTSGVLTSEEYQNHAGIFLVCSEDSSRVAAASYICDVLKSYGLNLRMSIVDRDSYEDALEDGDFDLYYGETRLTANFDLSEFFKENGDLCYGSIDNDSLVDLSKESLENSGKYVELCSQVMKKAPICPVVFKSYSVYVTRGIISNMYPALDFVFHNYDFARDLADADKTYDPEPEESTEVPTEEETASSEPEE